jgi:hypothetical protein
MQKPESAAAPAPEQAPGAVPQASREGSSRWNTLEIGFFSAGDAPVAPPEETSPLLDAGETERVFRIPYLSRLWGRTAASWRRLGLDWRAMALVFGPGTLIGIVLLLAGGSSSGEPIPALPAASMSSAHAPAAPVVAPPPPAPVVAAPVAPAARRAAAPAVARAPRASAQRSMAKPRAVKVAKVTAAPKKAPPAKATRPRPRLATRN